MRVVSPPTVPSELFSLMRSVNVDALASLSSSSSSLRPALASLVRLALIASLDGSAECRYRKSLVLQTLCDIETVNNLVALLSIDLHELESDARKELLLRSKTNTLSNPVQTSSSSTANASESFLVPSSSSQSLLVFERSDATRKLRLVLSELLALIAGSESPPSPNSSSKGSELFDHLVYFSEVCDVLCIAMAELPSLLKPTEVCEALLRLKYGGHIICHVVVNQPDVFSEVVVHLINNGTKQDENENNKVREEAILLLCTMAPTDRMFVRQKCVTMTKMPSLALRLTLEHAKFSQHHQDDVIPFLSGLLLGSDVHIRSWISFYVRSAQKNGSEALRLYREALQDHLLKLINMAMEKDKNISDDDRTCRQVWVVKAASILRLYCALKGIAGLKFSETEIDLLLSLITVRAPKSASGEKFISIALCVLFACHSLIATQEREAKVVKWLKFIVGNSEESNDPNNDDGRVGGLSELLFLVGIHFHSNQLQCITDLVCQTLGMKIRTNALSRMKIVFTQDLFTEEAIANHAVRVSVTRQLSSKVQGFLPVHCMLQLLKSRAFSKHRVSVTPWITQQVRECATPLHPIMSELIELLVNSILVPSHNRGVAEPVNEAIPEGALKAIFGGTNDLESCNKRNKISSMSSQVLGLFYLLTYESVRQSNMKNFASQGRRVVIYSKDLWSRIPIKYILNTSERQQESYGSVYHQLLRLCVSQFPQLCLVDDWLRQDLRRPMTSNHMVSMTQSIGPDRMNLSQAIASLPTCPGHMALTLKRLLKEPPESSWKAVMQLTTNIKCFLDAKVPRHLSGLFKELWFEVNNVLPRRLWAVTANALLSSHGTTNINSKSSDTLSSDSLTMMVSLDDLMLDPLILLRCDRRVFRNGHILEIVLYELKAVLAASRSLLAKHIVDNPLNESIRNTNNNTNGVGNNSNGVNDGDREELKNALIATQESAVIQILLEAILPLDEERKGNDDGALSDLREARSLVCLYLHEAFIAEPNLAKLVHFQGYPPELLSLTVSGIPSMHICLDFVPELLSQPEIPRQSFAVALVSHLSLHFSMPKSFSIARLAINTLSTLLTVYGSSERQELFNNEVLRALPRIARAFPPLVEDTCALLIQYAKINRAERAMKPFSEARLRQTVSQLRSGADEREYKYEDDGDEVHKSILEALRAISDEALLENNVY